jgi:ABC-type phosphate transport system permease subunit
MGLTALISLPIGVSVGVFIQQYAGRRLAGVISFSTTALRSISGIILLVTVMSLLEMPAPGSILYYLFHGYGYDVNGTLQVGRSSFLLTSVFISLLVIPLIARTTQEGLNSLPKEIHEGSLALGASKEHTLFHIQLPWSLPNIITGLLLGCAEAAGALTIIFLIAGTGEYGVSPLNETTSLAYLIFDCRYGRSLGDAVQDIMGSYQYTASLVLLIMTLGLTTAALLMKRNFAKRYKGA